MSDTESLTLSVDQTAKLLGLSRNGAYEAIARGDVPSIRIGRRLLVPRVALERMLCDAGNGPDQRGRGVPANR
jgi:excisionase family DNA binding protein